MTGTQLLEAHNEALELTITDMLALSIEDLKRKEYVEGARQAVRWLNRFKLLSPQQIDDIVASSLRDQFKGEELLEYLQHLN